MTSKTLRYFSYEHLPPHLQEVSKPFHDLAKVIDALPATDIFEKMASLRKLLEAKDAAVRCILPDREGES